MQPQVRLYNMVLKHCADQHDRAGTHDAATVLQDIEVGACVCELTVDLKPNLTSAIFLPNIGRLLLTGRRFGDIHIMHMLSLDSRKPC